MSPVGKYERASIVPMISSGGLTVIGDPTAQGVYLLHLADYFGSWPAHKYVRTVNQSLAKLFRYRP